MRIRKFDSNQNSTRNNKIFLSVSSRDEQMKMLILHIGYTKERFKSLLKQRDSYRLFKCSISKFLWKEVHYLNFKSNTSSLTFFNPNPFFRRFLYGSFLYLWLSLFLARINLLVPCKFEIESPLYNLHIIKFSLTRENIVYKLWRCERTLKQDNHQYIVVFSAT